MLNNRLNHLIDINYCGYKQLGCVYLLTGSNNEGVLIDSGTPRSFDLIVKEIRDRKVDLKGLLLTHCHLDHTGNTSLFHRNFPSLPIFCSEGTAEVLINPSNMCRRMAASLGGRWLPEFKNEVLPVPAKAFSIIKEGSEIKFGSRTLKVLETPGHSADHISFLDNDLLFTGDCYGVRYSSIKPVITIFAGAPDFNPEKVFSTLDKLDKLPVKRIALGHFGFVEDVDTHRKECRMFAENLMKVMDEPDIVKSLKKLYEQTYGVGCMKKWRRLNGSFGVNYAGIKSWLNRKTSKKTDDLARYFKVSR